MEVHGGFDPLEPTYPRQVLTLRKSPGGQNIYINKASGPHVGVGDGGVPLDSTG